MEGFPQQTNPNTSSSPRRLCTVQGRTDVGVETCTRSRTDSQEGDRTSSSTEQSKHGSGQLQVYESAENLNGLAGTPEQGETPDALSTASTPKRSTGDTREGGEERPFDCVIFIDSTWNQCGVISRDERLAGKF